MARYGALEAGGTKMVLGVMDDRGQALARQTVPTLEPENTMPAMLAFFREHPVDALGIGSFGPLELNPNHPDYGCITTTPKQRWRGYPLLQTFRDALGVPCAIDTDVNVAMLAEATLGAAKGLTDAVYVTVGTGIGAGVMSGGKLVHGLMHPELGHILLRPRADDPLPRGVCPYHDGCLEGLASGPALGKRAGCDARELPDEHPLLRLEAHYLAQMCMDLVMTLSPQRILLGGGVMARAALYPMIRKELAVLLGGYYPAALTADYILPPELYPDSGLLGAYLLSKMGQGL